MWLSGQYWSCLKMQGNSEQPIKYVIKALTIEINTEEEKIKYNAVLGHTFGSSRSYCEFIRELTQ